MDWLLKRDETKIYKHLIHRTNKYCILYIISCREAIELFTIRDITAVELKTLDEHCCDHVQ